MNYRKMIQIVGLPKGNHFAKFPTADDKYYSIQNYSLIYDGDTQYIIPQNLIHTNGADKQVVYPIRYAPYLCFTAYLLAIIILLLIERGIRKRAKLHQIINAVEIPPAESTVDPKEPEPLTEAEELEYLEAQDPPSEEEHLAFSKPQM